jgi:hypothetical protein
MEESDASLPPPDVGSSDAPATPRAQGSAHESWRTDRLLLGTLLLLSLVGIAVADFSARSGLTYWLWMVPVFAGASILMSWTRARREGQGVARILTENILHWAPLPAALYIIYRLEDAGRLNREDAGLVALLSVALTTLLAGVHFDWRIAVLGLLLGAASFCAALVEEFFWLLLLPALLAGGVLLFWQRRSHEHASKPTQPT